MIVENVRKGSFKFSAVMDEQGELWAVVTDFVSSDDMSMSRVFQIEDVDEIFDSILERDHEYKIIEEERGSALHNEILTQVEECELEL